MKAKTLATVESTHRHTCAEENREILLTKGYRYLHYTLEDALFIDEPIYDGDSFVATPVSGKDAGGGFYASISSAQLCKPTWNLFVPERYFH